MNIKEKTRKFIFKTNRYIWNRDNKKIKQIKNFYYWFKKNWSLNC